MAGWGKQAEMSDTRSDVKSILVCGGAGYIGSHMVRLLADGGHRVTVFDNLSTGHVESIPGIPFVEGDLLDPGALEQVFTNNRFDAVFHFSALLLVGESVEQPDRYYLNNVTGTLNLLNAMRRAGVDRFVFSSSAAVYGNPTTDLIEESHRLAPINPYGWTKRMIEQVLADYASAFGLRSVAFRYFNAAGAHPDGTLGEAHDPETHLIPNILLAALGKRDALNVFGDDYETRDGTCIRDYIHILDICKAHLTALDWMDGKPGADVFNLGNGTGFSTMEVVEAARRVTGVDIPVRIAPRREGDPAILVADSRRARSLLGWEPQYADLESIMETAWRWHRNQKY
jgi:UDP-glucose 4-epimerase